MLFNVCVLVKPGFVDLNIGHVVLVSHKGCVYWMVQSWKSLLINRQDGPRV